MANKLVQQLTSVLGLNVECPCCGEAFPLKSAGLFSMYETTPLSAMQIIRDRQKGAVDLLQDAKERKKQLALDRKRKPLKVSVSTEATNFGQHCEQIIPAFSEFPYKQGDCRILFKPIDYILFEGLSRGGSVEAIKFVEFKTGGGSLGQKQRQIRNCVAAGRVSHEVLGK